MKLNNGDMIVLVAGELDDAARATLEGMAGVKAVLTEVANASVTGRDQGGVFAAHQVYHPTDVEG